MNDFAHARADFPQAKFWLKSYLPDTQSEIDPSELPRRYLAHSALGCKVLERQRAIGSHSCCRTSLNTQWRSLPRCV